MNETNKVSSFSVLAIMSIAFISMGVGTITPAIQSIMEAFPDLSVTTLLLVSTLPSLLCIPASLFAGAVAGSKVKYKALTVAGILLFVIGGVLPAFTNNDFTVILIERAIFGIGLGIISPLGNALILGLYEGDKRNSMLGLFTVISNVGGIVLQFLGGYFAGIKWYYSFYPHALGIISFVLVLLFLPEPAAAAAEGAERPKVKLPGSAWLVSVLFGILMLLIYPMLVNMSTFLMTTGLGNSAASGVVLSFYTIGGMIAGVIFSSFYKISKKFIVALAAFLTALGLVLVLYGGNIALVSVGVALAGIGFFTIMPTVIMILGMIVKPESFAMASSVLIAAMNLFGFLSTYWIGMIGKITGDAVVQPIFVSMLLFAVTGIIFLFVNPIPNSKTAK